MEIKIKMTAKQRVNIIHNNIEHITTACGAYGRGKESMEFISYILKSVVDDSFDYEELYSYDVESISIDDLMERMDDKMDFENMDEGYFSQMMVDNALCQDFFEEQRKLQMKNLY